jgi:hypothetical protein
MIIKLLLLAACIVFIFWYVRHYPHLVHMVNVIYFSTTCAEVLYRLNRSR